MLGSLWFSQMCLPFTVLGPVLHLSIALFFFLSLSPCLSSLLSLSSFLEDAVVGVISMHTAFQSSLTCPLASWSQGSPSPMATVVSPLPIGNFAFCIQL